MLLNFDIVKNLNPCADELAWYVSNPGRTVEKTIETLLGSSESEKYNWTNWLLTHVFTKEQNIKYAIFAAKEVLYLFEAKHPGDLRPKNAIEAAEKYLITEGADAVGVAAWAAAWAARAAADATRAAADATWAAAWAARDAAGAWAARDAADAAVWAARAAADAAADASWAAADATWAAARAAADATWAAGGRGAARDAADAARDALYIKIISYGLELLK